MTHSNKAIFLDTTSPPTLVTLIMLASIGAAGMNIYLPSLPAMATEMHTTTATLSLSISVYLAVSAVIQLISGPISDRFGRRPVILGSLFIFISASIACAYTTSLGAFLVFRSLQATIGVCMTQSRAIIRDTTSTIASGSKIAYVTMGMSLVPMITPAIGGLIDTHLSWHYNFYLLATLGTVILIISYFDLGETLTSPHQNIWSQFHDYPTILKSRRFWGYCLAASLSSGAFFAYLGGAPFVGTEIFNLNPSQLGLFFGLPGIGYFIGNFISGRFSTKVGIDNMIIWGLYTSFLGIVSALLLSTLGLGTVFSFFIAMAIVGVGNGMTISNANAGMLSINPQLAGTAAGLGGSILIAGGGMISAFAAVALNNSLSERPLLYLMLLSLCCGIASIYYVKARNKKLAG